MPCPQCVGVSAFGFIVANISSLISTLDVRGSALTERLSEVREYLHDRKVPFDLQRRVMKFFHHLWSHGSLFDEMGILASLPPPLRNDIVFWGRSDTIQRIKLLNGQDRHLISMLVRGAIISGCMRVPGVTADCTGDTIEAAGCRAARCVGCATLDSRSSLFRDAGESGFGGCRIPV